MLPLLIAMTEGWGGGGQDEYMNEGGGEAKEMILFFFPPFDTKLIAIYNYCYCNFASGNVTNQLPCTILHFLTQWYNIICCLKALHNLLKCTILKSWFKLELGIGKGIYNVFTAVCFLTRL